MQTLEQIRAKLHDYPIEVAFPNIAEWQVGNTGVDYIHTFDSGVAGPHAMILALTHGNEVSGAITVDKLLRAGLRPLKGRLTLGFGNVEAYHRFDSRAPDASRFIDEDMNRVWSAERLDGCDDSQELRRARALRPIIDSVDFLLDLHSMHEEAPPLMLSGPLEKGIRFAIDIGVPEHVIVDAGHANGKRLRDYDAFGDPASPKNALLIETGQHFSIRSKDVALDAASRFLVQTGVVAAVDVTDFMQRATLSAQHVFEVTQPVIADTMDFEFMQDFRGLELIARAGTVIAHDGDKEIVTPYDDCVIIMPSLRHLGPGVTVMRLARVLNNW
ncbi:succinylglutamate desuccinylase / Aspartoacylase family protein [Collimonas arenae]|uniref:Succinylglutamate desuccinylase / Aspartoacylase family protein n=1 Tax=Collimonas arenae TaxID=279058 RepID=A0A127QHC1_9BURK|nr:M14 family metallopeptidase [Collimonas arenae]AMO99505.1 succinylglutamate desuccinylase / Aspartoacylase family protein [Collimonas arenae]AMP09404.1 succinylglutamate desuccinylase / Aspartoacylase family protein [Collimonas arenae]